MDCPIVHRQGAAHFCFADKVEAENDTFAHVIIDIPHLKSSSLLRNWLPRYLSFRAGQESLLLRLLFFQEKSSLSGYGFVFQGDRKRRVVSGA